MGCLFNLHKWHVGGKTLFPDYCERCHIRRELVDPTWAQWRNEESERIKQNAQVSQERIAREREEWDASRKENGRGWRYDDRMYDPEIRREIQERVYGKRGG
jgi:hypothetical protein